MNTKDKTGTPKALVAALEIWHGEDTNVSKAQQALYHWAKCNQAARRGEYNASIETT